MRRRLYPHPGHRGPAVQAVAPPPRTVHAALGVPMHRLQCTHSNQHRLPLSCFSRHSLVGAQGCACEQVADARASACDSYRQRRALNLFTPAVQRRQRGVSAAARMRSAAWSSERCSRKRTRLRRRWRACAQTHPLRHPPARWEGSRDSTGPREAPPAVWAGINFAARKHSQPPCPGPVARRIPRIAFVRCAVAACCCGGP